MCNSVTMPGSDPCPESKCCGLSSRGWKAGSLVFLIDVCSQSRYNKFDTNVLTNYAVNIKAQDHCKMHCDLIKY